MRKIRFRGKQIDGRGWAYGDLLTEYIHHKKGLTIVEDGCVYCEVESASVGQYIGLNDKNERHIYEGDIVRCNEFDDPSDCWFAQVKYHADRGYPAFELEPYPDVDCNAISHYNAVGEIQVIGNIYENQGEMPEGGARP